MREAPPPSSRPTRSPLRNGRPGHPWWAGAVTGAVLLASLTPLRAQDNPSATPPAVAAPDSAAPPPPPAALPARAQTGTAGEDSLIFGAGADGPFQLPDGPFRLPDFYSRVPPAPSPPRAPAVASPAPSGEAAQAPAPAPVATWSIDAAPWAIQRIQRAVAAAPSLAHYLDDLAQRGRLTVIRVVVARQRPTPFEAAVVGSEIHLTEVFLHDALAARRVRGLDAPDDLTFAIARLTLRLDPGAPERAPADALPQFAPDRVRDAVATLRGWNAHAEAARRMNPRLTASDWHTLLLVSRFRLPLQMATRAGTGFSFAADGTAPTDPDAVRAVAAALRPMSMGDVE